MPPQDPLDNLLSTVPGAQGSTPRKDADDLDKLLSGLPGPSQSPRPATPSPAVEKNYSQKAMDFTNETLGNIPGSAGRFIGGLYDAARSPIKTTEGVLNTAGGVLEQMTPGGPQGLVPYAEAAEEGLKERYGSIDALGNTIRTDPVGFAADVSAVADAASIPFRGGAAAARAVGAGRTARGLEATADAAKTVSRYTNPITPIVGTVKLGARGAKNLALGEVDLLSGAGAGALERATQTRSQAFLDAMRGKTPAEGILGDMQNALQGAIDKRGAKYRQDLAEIQRKTGNAAHPDWGLQIKDALKKQMDNLNVEVVPPKPNQASFTNPADYAKAEAAWKAQWGDATPGSLSYQNSKVAHASDMAAIQGVYDKVNNWTDWTVTGVDNLKQALRNFYTETGHPAYSRVGNTVSGTVGATTRDLLRKNVPGYSAMSAAYEKATDFIQAAQRDLSLNTNANPGTAVRKITTAFRQNNLYRQALIEALDDFAPGHTLRDSVAGLHLSSWKPVGIGRPLMTATGAGGLIWQIASGAITPAAALPLLTASPRLMGETLSMMGVLRKYAGIADNATRASAILQDPAFIRIAQGGYRDFDKVNSSRQITVTDPRGTVHSFTSPADAAAFKREAGIK